MAAAGLLVAGCSSSSSSKSTSGSSSGGAAATTTAGATSSAGSTTGSSSVAKKITVWTASNPLYDYQKSTLAAFTKSTGISVDFQEIPEASILTKLQAAQTGKDKSFDFYEVPASLTPQYVSLKGAQPIKPFLDNTSQTPASFDFAGIPTGSMSQCTIGGTLYCLPAFSTGPELFYNKAFFKQAGLSGPPQSMADLVSDATKLTNSSHAGMCLRGSNDAPNGFPGQMLLLYYLQYHSNDKGVFLDSNSKPRFTDPQALKMASDYSTLMTKDAPKGVGAYGYPECLSAMQNGKVAMWLDDSAAASYVFNSKASAVPNIGYASIPCPSTNPAHCQLSAPWGMFINSNVDTAHQAAAWKMMTWFGSKSFQTGALTKGHIPALVTRASVLTANPTVTGVPSDLLTSLAYIQTHIDPNAIPQFASFNAVQQPFFVGLSNIISGQSSPDTAFKNVQDQMTALLKRNGVLK